ncbi:MAG: type 2 isopentenyl-diphosphate Delta-isomerase [Deltaproteobacteria bacterium]|nr:type 2 isopentenyl-diphosphate Delta-isomerase [Deltaproteobacteria bacterium]MBK8237621.1 type 2 isopentenyl-diphosphate Delta-isomerase [Deltaproteobacteria bacterium]MBP7287536.1 type 2 isopentenyl-diphosphate Delta-isomerase [Nannocystaceae bacterium]
MADRLDISQRKKDHLALCAGPNVGFREKSTLLECVELVHDALPEMHADEVDTTTELLGRKLSAPVIVAAMTGGTEKAAEVNRDIARAADELGLAFGLGSQRAMFVRPETAWTFEIREVAPNVLLLGNLGIVQARSMSTQQIADLCGRVDANALCLHLNPAMEIVQPGGDRDFSRGLETMRRLVEELAIPVVAKETGCGLSRRVAQRIIDTGVRTVDTSGAGGTSWVAVEAHRAVDEDDKAIAEELWDWGIPTAASVLQMADLPLSIIATGGLRNGSDVARAVALGATCGGIAAAVLKAHKVGGYEGAKTFLRRTMLTVRAIMLLCGCKTVADLRRTPKIITGALAAWQPDRSSAKVPR